MFINFVIVRLQRALSHPNLMYHEDGEEEEGPTTNGNEENHIPLRGALSNPHLLDMDTTPHSDSDLTLDKVTFYFLITAQDMYIE